jgi:hypothetical protein
MRRIGWLRPAALTMSACAFLGAMAAPAAHADSAEEQFLKAVIGHGLSGGQSTWLQEGQTVCTDLATNAAMGVSPQKSGFTEIQKAGARGWRPGEAVVLITAAGKYLCPQNQQ